MTLVKSEVKPIKVRQEGEIDGRTTAKKIAARVGTPSLIWLLVKRHKIALLVLGNIILVLNWVLPPWTYMLRDLITGLF